MQQTSTARVTLDGSGNGSVVLGPVPAWQRWSLSRVVVSTSDTGPAIPLCVVYIGSAEGGRRLDATHSGNGDVSDFSSPVDLAAGYFLTVTWEGGTAGDAAVAELFYTPSRGW